MAMIKNDKEALTHALILAVTAPENKLKEVVKIAEDIASRLDDDVIEACKDEAVAWIDAQEELKRNEDLSIH
jgi:hypothetical protein